MILKSEKESEASPDFSKLDIRFGEGYSILRVRVTPKASRNEIIGVGEGTLRLRIQAPPVEGAANDKTRDFLAKLLGCSRGSIRLERGQASRDKAFRIEGMRPEEILSALISLSANR